MELVYLWVEDYKNIHEQGFNFSPRFECGFDGEKLSICDKKKKECKDNNYIENFFGENINVTAIVGKNGSGKSSVLNSIVNIVEDDPTSQKKYILLFADNENIIYYYSNFELETSLVKDNDLSKISKLIIYLDRENNDNIPIDMGATHLSSQSNHPWVKYNEIDILKEVIVNLLAVEIGKTDSSFELSTFMYLPNKIYIKLKTPEELIGKFIRFTLKDRQEIENYFISLTDREHQLLIIEYLRLNRSDDDILNKVKSKRNLPPLKNDILSFINEKEININELTETEKNIYLRTGGYNHLLNFDLRDEKKRRYNNLSHGEKVLFGQLLNLYFYTIHATNSNNIFLFDEPETALHPDWQKRYMNEVINLLKKAKGNNHFIFSSHSPFLLSDIPKQNIIFLDKDKNENCKVVDGLKEKKQTFGANIHTLLSDSFFMDNGLMGEFAKSKIDEVINYLNVKDTKMKNDDEAQKLINIIGEPIVKNQLQRMLDSKRLKKVDEIDAINEKIKNISYELEILKEYQSKIAQDELRDSGKKKYKERFIDDKNKL